MREPIIFSYIEDENLDGIRKIIRNYKMKNQNTNFNEGIRGDFQYTPLHYAVLRNRYNIVKILIEETANPNIKILETVYPESNGILALYLSENFGKYDITKILKPYTKNYNNSQLYFSIKILKTCLFSQKELIKIKNILTLILLIDNRLYNLKSYWLPTELWFLILEKIKLKELSQFT